MCRLNDWFQIWKRGTLVVLGKSSCLYTKSTSGRNVSIIMRIKCSSVRQKKLNSRWSWKWCKRRYVALLVWVPFGGIYDVSFSQFISSDSNRGKTNPIIFVYMLTIHWKISGRTRIWPLIFLWWNKDGWRGE